MVDVRTVPKVDLHVHLEGSLTSDTISELTRKHGILNNLTKTVNPYSDFFQNFKNVMSLLKEPEDYYRSVLNFLQSQSVFGTIYCEFYISISSYLHTNGLVKDVFDCVGKAIDEAENKFGIYSNVIVDLNRTSSWDPTGEIALAYAVANRQKHVVGIGLGGDEKGRLPEVFSSVFEKASNVGLGCVAHAGEAANFKSVIETINKLGVSRIGHGVRAIESEDAVELLKERKILVEICPTSECLTGATPSINANPIFYYLNLGIPVSIGTDDQYLFDTNPTKELEKILEAFPEVERYLISMLSDSINYSFAPTETKKILAQKLSLDL